MCVGCRRTAPATDLVRVSLGPDGRPRTGTGTPGRGAWLCLASPSCVDGALRRRAFDRALRATLAAEALAEVRALVLGTGGLGEGGAEVCEDGASARTVGARPETGKGS
jgi:predicted RNA-binding protein YlxR (DUF448 family)